MNREDCIDSDLQQRVRGALDTSADDLDMVTAARLHAARRRALERAGRRRWLPGWAPLLLPAGATAALVTLLAGAPAPEPAAPAEPVRVAEVVRDLDLLTAGESLDLYQDLEFYRWLPDSPDPGQRS